MHHECQGHYEYLIAGDLEKFGRLMSRRSDYLVK
jgi:hypothetical protein